MSEISLELQQTRISSKREKYKEGLKDGMPIGLGYVSVSMAFGMLAVSGGLSPFIAVLISMTNLTSAGQFAGLGLLLAGASYFELGLTVFIINIRYALMSLALSQRLASPFSTLQKMLIACGVTDETFAVASLKKGTLSYPYLLGLITLPYLGWALGTYLGAAMTSFLPIALQDALGIALYAMFIALIVPVAKQSKAVRVAVAIAISVSCIFYYVPVMKHISSGFAVILTTLIAACIAAYFFPVEEEPK